MPIGTFAGTGAGWIMARAPDLDDHVVRLERHDSSPPADHAEFADVLEAPYLSGDGGLHLAIVAGGYGSTDLDIGSAEWFRVRVARRPSEPERYDWVLKFWPAPPPVWLAPQRAGGPPRLHGLALRVAALSDGDGLCGRPHGDRAR